MVRNDSEATGVADLKGKAVSVPRRTREHCILFLERELKLQGAEAKDYFGSVVNHASIEDALDDILRGKVQAALVDGVSLDTYEQVKSGCFARLKVLTKSEAFPAAVVAYKQGTLDKATLGKFRNGMINANQTSRGRDLMGMWKLTAFESIPEDFPQTLAAILKAYPAPAPAARSKN